MSASDMLYEAHDLRHVYSGRDALRVDELAVARGSILGLAGPNGSGKSTLLRILAFLMAPASGALRFDGLPVNSEAQRARLRRQATLLLQKPTLLKRSVRDNVAYGLKIRGQKTGLDEQVAQVLDMVGLDPARFVQRRWFELSGGEAQRVALAARLALRPKALLLDEPTASLDTASAERILRAALHARREWATTLVVVSHDARWLASVADHVLRLGLG